MNCRIKKAFILILFFLGLMFFVLGVLERINVAKLFDKERVINE